MKTAAQGRQMFIGLGWVGGSRHICCGINCIIAELGKVVVYYKLGALCFQFGNGSAMLTFVPALKITVNLRNAVGVALVFIYWKQLCNFNSTA